MLCSLLVSTLVSVAAARLLLENRAISGRYPIEPNSTGGTLLAVKPGKTRGGFYDAPKGWNTWGIQINPNTTPSAPAAIAPLTNQVFVIEQCSVLADPTILAAGFDLCSLDGGWYSSTATDKDGRTTYNTSRFDIPALADYLHSKGLRLGLYNMPNVPCEAANKTIYGTSSQVGTTFNGVEDEYGLCYFNYSHPNTQLYHNSLIDLWASWGVDMIKLDYITPGSSVGDYGVPADTSGAVVAYHQAIFNNGRQSRLDVLSNVCRSDPYLGIWEENPDSIRIAVDINNSNDSSFVGIWKIQATIEQYCLYINQLASAGTLMVARPDFDNLCVGNPANVSGITDGQRITVMSHWMGAAANLILGSDMTSLDELGRNLVISSTGIQAADFCGKYPMQPRNPGTGNNQAQQLQAWVCGPSSTGQGYVLLTNLGPNEGRGGYETVGSGTQNVSIKLTDLGLIGLKYLVSDVWSGNSSTVVAGGSLSAVLGKGESQFLRITYT
jgi:alpha-galactosidase